MSGAALMRRSRADGEWEANWEAGWGGVEAFVELGWEVGAVLEVAFGAVEAGAMGGRAMGMEGSPGGFTLELEKVGRTSGCEEGGREAMLWFEVGLDVEGVSGEGGEGESRCTTPWLGPASASASLPTSASPISTSPSASFCALAWGEAGREDEEAMEEGRRVGFGPRRVGALPRRRGMGDGGSELGLYGGSALAVVEDDEPEDSWNGESERSCKRADSENKTDKK